MTVTADILDRLNVDHAVYKRVRMACRHAAPSFDLDQHALLVAGLVCSLRTTSDGPGSASPAETRATRAETGGNAT